MSQQVLEKARELAAAIAQSDEYAQMRQAEEEASVDEGLEAIYQDYSLKQKQVEEATKADQPDYTRIGDLTRQMEGVEDTLRRNKQMQRLTNARTAFSVMMSAVNQELQRVLQPEDEQEGCGEDGCAGCSGCGVR